MNNETRRLRLLAAARSADLPDFIIQGLSSPGPMGPGFLDRVEAWIDDREAQPVARVQVGEILSTRSLSGGMADQAIRHGHYRRAAQRLLEGGLAREALALLRRAEDSTPEPVEFLGAYRLKSRVIDMPSDGAIPLLNDGEKAAILALEDPDGFEGLLAGIMQRRRLALDRLLAYLKASHPQP